MYEFYLTLWFFYFYLSKGQSTFPPVFKDAAVQNLPETPCCCLSAQCTGFAFAGPSLLSIKVLATFVCFSLTKLTVESTELWQAVTDVGGTLGGAGGAIQTRVGLTHFWACRTRMHQLEIVLHRWSGKKSSTFAGKHLAMLIAAAMLKER